VSPTYGYQPILYLLGMFFWFGAAFVLAKGNLRQNFFNPIVMFALSFGIVHFGAPALGLFNEHHAYSTIYSFDTTLRAFCWFMVFGFVTVGVYQWLGGTKMFERNREQLYVFSKWETIRPKVMLWLLVILLIPACIALGVQLRLILSEGLQGYLKNRITLQAGGQIFIAPMNLFAGSLLIYFVNGLVRSKFTTEKINPAVLLPLMVASIIAGLVQGSRMRTLLAVLLLALTLFILHARGESSKRIVWLFVPGIVMIFSVGIALQQIRAQFVKSEQAQVALEGDQLLGDASDSFREYENTFWLIEHRNEWETAKGVTFAAAAAAFIPRSLWQEKPLGGGPFIRNLIKPGTYDFNSGLALTSYTTGIVAEGYINFGDIGFIISGVIFGLVLIFVTHMLKYGNSVIPFAAWMALLYRGIDLQRGEFLGGIANAVFFCMPLVLVYWILRYLQPDAMVRERPAPLAAEGA
jgi:hypothetical protein